MKKTTFEKKQAEKFEKFLERFEKAKSGKNFRPHEYVFCKYKDGYLFGDMAHFEYAKVGDIAERFKQYDNGTYTRILQTWSDLGYSWIQAEPTFGKTSDGKKIVQCSNATGHTYLNAKLLPTIPDGGVVKVCTINPQRYPAMLAVDGEPWAYICPIYNPNMNFIAD